MKRTNYGFTPIIILSIVTLILVGMVGFYLSLGGRDKGELKTSQVPTTDQVANWKTYKDEFFNFSIMYPSDMTVEGPFGDDWGNVRYMRLQRGDEEILTISTSDQFIEESVGNFMGGKPIEKRQIGEEMWNYYNFYYKDKIAENLQYNAIAYELVRGGFLYTIRFKGQKELTVEQNQILSTFKFTD